VGSKSKARTNVCGKQRGVISGLEKVIRNISSWPEVTTVNSCNIKYATSSGKNLVVKVIAHLDHGVQCVARRGNQRQTFYVLTSNPKIVADKINKEVA